MHLMARHCTRCSMVRSQIFETCTNLDARSGFTRQRDPNLMDVRALVAGLVLTARPVVTKFIGRIIKPLTLKEASNLTNGKTQK